jgi:nucleotide-binding universal stress UspA family protein
MKVLLAVDGSRFSDAAVEAVIAHAPAKGTEIRVLHVLERPSVLIGGEIAEYDPTLDETWEAERKQAEQLVEETAEQLRAKGLNAVGEVEDGNPKAIIPEVAKEWPADLVVLGSHGRKGIEHLLMGSVSETVARHASCSVAIVRIPAGR